MKGLMFLSTLTGMMMSVFAADRELRYQTHATAGNVHFAKTKAQNAALNRMGSFQQYCAPYGGNLTYTMTKLWALLEGPIDPGGFGSNFPAEYAQRTNLFCHTEKQLENAKNPNALEAFYYSGEDRVFFEIRPDLTFKTSLFSQFKGGEEILNLPAKLKRVGENRFMMNGVLNAYGKCQTNVAVEVEKLSDGTLVVTETSPKNLSFHYVFIKYVCNWTQAETTVYNLSPM